MAWPAPTLRSLTRILLIPTLSLLRSRHVLGAGYPLMAFPWSGRRLLLGTLERPCSWTRSSRSFASSRGFVRCASSGAPAQRPEAFLRRSLVSSRVAEPSGSDSHTGVALAFSPSPPVPEDVLRRVWEVLQSFKECYPSCVRTVDWFTPRGGILPVPPTRIVPISGRRSVQLSAGVALGSPPTRCAAGLGGLRCLPSRCVTWCRAGRDASSVLVEIERRPPPNALEKFSGLVFDLERRADFSEVLLGLGDVLRHELPPASRRLCFANRGLSWQGCCLSAHLAGP